MRPRLSATNQPVHPRDPHGLRHNGAARNRCGPNTAITATATRAYTARVMPSANKDGAWDHCPAGSRTSLPQRGDAAGIAGERENIVRLQHP